jgi:hypothetical protein
MSAPAPTSTPTTTASAAALTSVPAGAPVYASRNGEGIAGYTGTAREFLLAYPRGAYTTFRTVRTLLPHPTPVAAAAAPVDGAKQPASTSAVAEPDSKHTCVFELDHHIARLGMCVFVVFACRQLNNDFLLRSVS